MTRRLDAIKTWGVRHPIVTVVVLIVLLLGGLRFGGRPLARTLGMRSAPPTELTIFLTSDTRGHLEPCGCRSDQSGGLPVRATLVRRDGSSHRLLIDAGNVTYGSRKYDIIKLHYILKGMEDIGYRVVNLGATEVMLDKEDLLKTVGQHPRLRFISCNVIDARSRQLVAEPYIIEEVSGFRIGILGVVKSDLEVIGKGLAVVRPIEALSQWIPSLARRCDYLLVAAFVNQETMKEIANKFYEVDALLGGDVTESSNYPEKVNRALVFSVTDKGKVLGKIRLRRSKDRGLEVAAGEGIKVKDDIPGDDRMLKLVSDFKDELRRRRIELAHTEEHMEPIVSPARSPLADRYVGADACKECHKSAHRIWKESSHTESFEVLKNKKNQYDPECLSCHTLGYGTSDGYLSEEKTPPFAIVQCENCHGRGGKHVEAMRRGEKLALSTFRAVTPNTCIKCHDKENSENFNYATFWPAIEHGSDRKNGKRIKQFMRTAGL